MKYGRGVVQQNGYVILEAGREGERTGHSQ